jgi:2TM domain-containing protein
LKDQPEEQKSARLRLRAFGYHLIGYFAVLVVLVPINVLTTPENPWFVLPMVGWSAFLAIHAAYAMNLFGRLRGGGKR